MMPIVIRVIIIATTFALLGALGVGIYAGIQRYRGRTVPAGLLRVGAALLGAGLGSGFIYLIEEPTTLVPYLALPALVTYLLVQRGRRVAAGILLATLGLPGAVWWGYFLVQDILDPIDLYEAVLWLWWVPEAALLVGGTLLASRGDTSVPVRELIERTPAQIRDPIALANAFHRELAVGPVPIQTLVSVSVASLVIVLGIPLVIQAGLPWPIAAVIGTAVYTIIAVELWQLALPRRVRPAWEGFTLVSNPETKRWFQTTRTQIPRTRLAMQQWLKAQS